MPEITYSEAEDANSIARELIGDYHQHLADFTSRCIFRSESAKSKGKEVWARASIVKGRELFLEGAEYPYMLIEISATKWSVLSDSQKRALIDHELFHFMIGENGLGTVGHDVEEFTAVIHRHGLWSAGVREMAREMQQLSLDIDGSVVMKVSHETMQRVADDLNKADPDIHVEVHRAIG